MLQNFTTGYNIIILMKYKKLTQEQIIISLDRLTRFKFTKEKYFRVFSDIILSNLIEPKLKKSELLSINPAELKYYTEEIFNGSIEKNCNNFEINRKLYEYENSVFINDDYTKELLENKLNYYAALDLIDDSSHVNLKWLKSLKVDWNLKQAREEHLLKYPVEKVILVEGLTEEILLPAFSKFLGYDFYQKGIQVIGAGGKNQVAKLYCELKDELKLPIFVLLDADAQKTAETINGMLRNSDKIHLIHHGEFEDLFSLFLIKRTINNRYKNILQCAVSDFKSDKPMTKILADYFRINNLGDFQKAEFAKEVLKNIKGEADLTEEIRAIIAEIKKCGANC